MVQKIGALQINGQSSPELTGTGNGEAYGYFPGASAFVAQINKTTALCIFKEIPAGVYGISAFHDEDNDGKLDTNLVGYPTEDYCASNNARNMFSAPSWKDAKFSYKGGSVKLRGVMK